jgi:hypothetical protein
LRPECRQRASPLSSSRANRFIPGLTIARVGGGGATRRRFLTRSGAIRLSHGPARAHIPSVWARIVPPPCRTGPDCAVSCTSPSDYRGFALLNGRYSEATDRKDHGSNAHVWFGSGSNPPAATATDDGCANLRSDLIWCSIVSSVPANEISSSNGRSDRHSLRRESTISGNHVRCASPAGMSSHCGLSPRS